MRALKFTDVKTFEYGEVPTPKITDSQVLIQVKSTGICHSDVVSFLGLHPYRIPPVVTGHEFSGEIVEVGSKVTGSFSIGDRVVVEPHLGCGSCQYCLEGHYNICQSKQLIGAGQWSGSFGEYVSADPSMCIKMPNNMSFEEGSLLEPFCVGAHAARLAALPADASVAVLGCGTIGIMTILSLSLLGIQTIIGSDVSSAKAKWALQQGATHMVNPLKEDIVKNIMRITDDKGVDAVFIAAGFPDAFEQAYAISRRKGKIVIIALFDGPIDMNVAPIQQGERIVIGSNMYTMDDYRWAMNQYNQGKLSLTSLITKRIMFEEAGKIMEELSHGSHGDEVKIMISMD